MSETVEQNPWCCSDIRCVMAVKATSARVGTNSGCRCLRDMNPNKRIRVRKAIKWLKQRKEK